MRGGMRGVREDGDECAVGSPFQRVLGGPKEGPEQDAHAESSLRTGRLWWECQAYSSSPTVGKSLTFFQSGKHQQQLRMRKAQATVTVLVVEG